jgi:uncharacterized membrane protein
MFIALIENTLLQLHRMLAFTSEHGRRVIEQTYPRFEAARAIPDPRDYEGQPVTFVLTHEGKPKTIQALDIPALRDIATSTGAIIVVVESVGDTLIEDRVMLRVHGGKGTFDERTFAGVFAIGAERTFEQDPKYALRLLVDIAIRALSPAINDPTTAVQSLDQIRTSCSVSAAAAAESARCAIATEAQSSCPIRRGTTSEASPSTRSATAAAPACRSCAACGRCSPT